MKILKISQIGRAALVTMVAFLLLSALAFAQAEARVYLQPAHHSAEGALTVDVMAENVTDMYGAEFRLKYDPAMLSVQDVNLNQAGIQIEPGSLLPVDKGFVVANQVNEAEGTITFAMTLLNPAPPANGSGPLARITFNKLQAGTSTTVEVERAKLVAIDLQTIPSQTEAFVVNADPATDQQTTTGPAPTTAEAPPASSDGNFPWWIVAAAIMVLGIVALGGFIVMGDLNSNRMSAAGSAPPGDPTAEPNPVHRARARPSAFKR